MSLTTQVRWASVALSPIWAGRVGKRGGPGEPGEPGREQREEQKADFSDDGWTGDFDGVGQHSGRSKHCPSIGVCLFQELSQMETFATLGPNGLPNGRPWRAL